MDKYVIQAAGKRNYFVFVFAVSFFKPLNSPFRRNLEFV